MPLRQELTQFDFHHRLVETRGIALVWFSTPHCGACRRLEQILERYGDDLGLDAIYHVDAGREMALTREFEVFHLPAMFLYRDGHYHSPLHAEAQPELLKVAIARTLAAPPEEEP